MRNLNDAIFFSIFEKGFESLSTVLSHFILLVALYPDVQEKIFRELQAVFTSADEDVTNEKFEQLIYLDLVLKETMRFWTPVLYISRRVGKDIDIGSHTIPAGTNILTAINNLHFNKSFWGDDVNEFKPERFSPENYEKVPPYAYMPFSRGQRNCIGYKYALNAMKVTLTHFFRNFKASTTLKLEDITFEYVIVTKVLPGCLVSIQKRDFEEMA